MRPDIPSILRIGEAAILVQFDPVIADNKLKLVLKVREMILQQKSEVKLQVITAYNSLLVIYPSIIEDFYSEKNWLVSVVEQAKVQKSSNPRRLLLPVCYDPSLAPDLDYISEKKNLNSEDIISIHSEAEYRVFMIGFLPGFPYLGGLDKRLEIPRKKEPRRKVAAGSVGIAGLQTGIYPMESPGGWQIIGCCPIPLFDPLGDPPCPLAPGDMIQFRKISLAQYEEIKQHPAQYLETI